MKKSIYLIFIISLITLSACINAKQKVAGTYETDEGIKVFLTIDGTVEDSGAETYGIWRVEGGKVLLEFQNPSPYDEEFSNFFEKEDFYHILKEDIDDDSEYQYVEGKGIYRNTYAEDRKNMIKGKIANWNEKQSPTTIEFSLKGLSKGQKVTVQYIGGVEIIDSQNSYEEDKYNFLDNDEINRHIWKKID